MIQNLVLGAMYFGTVQDERTSFTILDHFVDAGGTWIDTANCYSFWADPSGAGGQSEALIGRWLARRSGLRDRLKISTKVGAEPNVPGSFPRDVEGLSARVVRAGVQASLRRLGTDHLDLYWAHMPDPGTPLEETVGALDDLVSDGTVGRVGCSNYPVWQVERARQIAQSRGGSGFSAVQQHHTYLQPRPGTRPTVVHRFGAVTDEVLHYVEHHHEMMLWAYTPLLTGRYTRPDRPLHEEYDHPGTNRRLAVLDDVSAETGTNRNCVVLAWLSGGHPVVQPIVGVSSIQQLDDAIAGVALELSPDQRARLDSAA